MIEALCVISLLILIYTYVGYPAAIWMLAHMAPRAIARRACEPTIAVIIVVSNEASRIGRKLDNCLALDYPKEKLRLVVASDGSGDETNEIVTAYADRRVTLLSFATRRGKAACLNDAMANCDEDVIVLMDARQRIDLTAIRHLAENFADPSIGAVSGELMLEPTGMTDFGEGVDAYWRYEKFIRKSESTFHSMVGVTGALYGIRRELFREVPSNTILDDVLIPMQVVMRGRRVVFDGRAKAYDLPSRDHKQEKVRKIRTIAGNYQLLRMHPSLLLPIRNPIWVQLVSHKVLRLVAPLFMLTLLCTSAMLASSSMLYRLLLGAQLFAYALPGLPFVWIPARKWKIVKLSRAFLTLNWFAVQGAVEYFRNHNAHLWASNETQPPETLHP